MSGRIGFQKLRESIRTSLWFVPAVAVLLAVLLSQVMLEVDRQYDIVKSGNSRFLFGGTADSAARILSTTAMAILTVTGVIFSVTMLVLQQASQQLSPRVLRTFLRDPGTQLVLGTLIGTFLYSLLVLRQVRTEGVGEEFVPSLAMAVGMGLVLASLALFIYFINHVAQSIRPSTIIGRIASETRDAIAHVCVNEGAEGRPRPAAISRPAGSQCRIITRKQPGGVVTRIDHPKLESIARDSGCTIEIVPIVGDFVREGGEVARLWGPGHNVDDQAILGGVSIDRERSMEQDPAFGFRQLVDIGERALSPGVNDPTTAIQALDSIHDLLGRLAEAEFPPVYRFDDGGRLLLITPQPGWEDYVALGLDELRVYGAGSIQVMRRIRFIVEDLLAIACEERKPALRRQLRLLDETLASGLEVPEDRATAARGSRQGHGPA